MINEISIIYIDDIIDEILSRYMSEYYCRQSFLNVETEVKKVYNEIKFNVEEGYTSLLQDTQVRAANVVLIDNRLFEERYAHLGKFSGKQFKVILRKLLPFVEVVIITQDKSLTGDNIIHKFSGRHREDPNQYYEDCLAKVLDSAIKEIIEFEDLADDLSQSTDVDQVLIEKILQSLQGDDSYDALTKADIDNLIESFKELKDYCD